jgi:DNA helicase TIP49 (TBP-interacting protein)
VHEHIPRQDVDQPLVVRLLQGAELGTEKARCSAEVVVYLVSQGDELFGGVSEPSSF